MIKPLLGLILSIILVTGSFWKPTRKIIFLLLIPVIIFLVIFALQSMQPTINYELDKTIICEHYNNMEYFDCFER